MKVLLALSLLFFLDSVFCEKDYIPCLTSNTCPNGYSVHKLGPPIPDDTCVCKKTSGASRSCLDLEFICRDKHGPRCIEMESLCTPTEIIYSCGLVYIEDADIALCDRAKQRLRKEIYSFSQKTCELYRDKCNGTFDDNCKLAARYCDPDTTIQLCKNKKLTDECTCQEAERNKDKERAEDSTHSCKNAQLRCQKGKGKDMCTNVITSCDTETAAKWCYEDDIDPMTDKIMVFEELEEIRDKYCPNVVQKYHHLMFGKNKDGCWTQIPLCERGDSKACMQVATLCGKEVTSALCNAKKIKSKHICKYTVLENTTSSSYPGCDFFAYKCKYNYNYTADDYCSLATRYCGNDVIAKLCGDQKITDTSICKKAQAGNSNSLAIPIPIVGGTVQLPGGFGLGF